MNTGPVTTDRQAVRDLVQAGLGDPVADEAFDRFARLVRRHLDVPTAMVSLVLPEGQVIPGAHGLPEPYGSQRRLPLTHSFCRFVVDERSPLVVTDARAEPRLRENQAIPDLGVVAYAGFPIFDHRGRVVGSLCAADDAPRVWTQSDLATLADLAAACTSELRLRAERERARRIQQVAVQANRRSRFLLTLSEAFADATSVRDVEEVLAHVGTSGIGARYAALVLMDTDRRGLTYASLDHVEPGMSPSLRHVLLDAERPTAHVARTRRPLWFRDHPTMIEQFPAVAGVSDDRVGARVFLPVVSGSTLLGVVVFAWERAREADDDALAVETALANYTAHALERVRFLEERRDVATTLQAAMLTALPEVQHLDLASTYSPATRTDQVGGDWYDAVVLDDDAAVLMIGDVTGHDMRAAATMGQLRSMLRALAWSHDESPAALLRLLDKANHGLGLHATGTAVVVRLDRVEDGFDMTWANAGHPPPLVLRADGSVEALDERPDLMLGIVPGTERTDRTTRLHPGETLLLYTDGLVEQRGSTVLERLDLLGEALVRARLTGTSALPTTLVRALLDGPQRDDVAVLAVRVRVPAPPGGSGMAGGPARAERKVASALSDLGPARHWVDDILEGCGVPRVERRTAMLLTSEILTNALEHGAAPFTATVEVDETVVRVGVRDASTARPRLRDPEPHEPGGRGVQFLERFASRWGVERHDGEPGSRRGVRRRGKTVWFELDRRAPTTGVLPSVVGTRAVAPPP